MAKLIYSVNVSLDGYIEDADGGFEWTARSDEVFAFISDRVRGIGTHLLGRRQYETMAVWETDPSLAEQSELTRDFAQIWQAAEKIVYSRSLEKAATGQTRIVREFEPVEVQRLKESAERDLLVGGAGLGAAAIRAGLVDEWHLYLVPVVVGGGKRALPTNVRFGLELLDERRFGNGTVHLRYRCAT